MTFDPSKPHSTNGTDINLTDDEIAAMNTLNAAYLSRSSVIIMNNKAINALAESDKTMLRIQEAVSLGLTTWATGDIVAWVNYRRSLRTLVTSNVAQSLPSKPAYPANT